MDLAVIRARHGELDQAVHHGLAAFGYDRKTEASLLARAADLDHILAERYPDERLTDDFHERYIDAHRPTTPGTRAQLAETRQAQAHKSAVIRQVTCDKSPPTDAQRVCLGN